jgi:hypothetical protein
MVENEQRPPKPVIISVDDKDVEVPSHEVTGLQIKQAAGVADDVELYGPKGQPVANEEAIRVHQGEKFTAITVPVVISVNRKDVEVPSTYVTGLQIKRAAGVPDEFQLFGPRGEPIADDQTVRVHKGEKFTAISGQDVS